MGSPVSDFGKRMPQRPQAALLKRPPGRAQVRMLERRTRKEESGTGMRLLRSCMDEGRTIAGFHGNSGTPWVRRLVSSLGTRGLTPLSQNFRALQVPKYVDDSTRSETWRSWRSSDPSDGASFFSVGFPQGDRAPSCGGDCATLRDALRTVCVPRPDCEILGSRKSSAL